jgi:hypothetical protein
MNSAVPGMSGPPVSLFARAIASTVTPYLLERESRVSPGASLTILPREASATAGPEGLANLLPSTDAVLP